MSSQAEYNLCCTPSSFSPSGTATPCHLPHQREATDDPWKKTPAMIAGAFARNRIVA
jgi:hypothetical protein